jgi:hypothetical protein
MRRFISGERSLVDDEQFDAMTDRVGKELDVNWGESQRLCVYLVPQEKHIIPNSVPLISTTS